MDTEKCSIFGSKTSAFFVASFHVLRPITKEWKEVDTNFFFQVKVDSSVQFVIVLVFTETQIIIFCGS